MGEFSFDLCCLHASPPASEDEDARYESLQSAGKNRSELESDIAENGASMPGLKTEDL